MKLKFIVSILIVQIFCGPLVFAQTDRGVANKPVGGKRLALVIGNGAYQKTSELPNPANDAADMAASLSSLGFEVLSGTNQSKRQMEILIREFGDKLSRQGGVGLFFYAGHGLQVKGSNYLIPVDAELPAEDEVEYATVNLNFLLNKMDAAKNELNIVILDACRNNPFARSWRNFRDVGEGGGLAKITPPTGTIMLYATQPGNVASDGTGRNGLFTESLLEQIRKPDVELDAMIKQLARDVSEKSGKKQMPWKEGIVTGDFYFAGGGSGSSASSSAAQPVSNPTVTNSVDVEEVMWQEVSRINTKLAVDSYLGEYPNGKYASTARLKLKVIAAEEEKKTKVLETQKWEDAGRTNTIESYQSYLIDFPSGEFRDQANQKISDLREKLRAANKPKRGGSIKNTLGMEFMGIPAGSFLMGSPKNEDDRGKDETPHQVTLTKSFWLGKHEITQSQWRSVMGNVPDTCFEKNEVRGDTRPVVCVSWDDVQEFITKLNAMGQEKYRVPTEAEWEYAARGESTRAYFFGDDENEICGYGNGKDSSFSVLNGKTMCRDGIKGTTTVGKFQPNNFGLHDTVGNVSEWVNDWYGDYSNGAQTDPAGPVSGAGRTFRGGNAFESRKNTRSAFRSFAVPSTRDYRVGFRLVMEN